MTPEQLEALFQGGAIDEETYLRSKEVLSPQNQMMSGMFAGDALSRPEAQSPAPPAPLQAPMYAPLPDANKPLVVPPIPKDRVVPVESPEETRQLEKFANKKLASPQKLPEQSLVADVKPAPSSKEEEAQMAGASFTKPPQSSKPIGVFSQQSQSKGLEGLGLSNFIGGTGDMAQAQSDIAIAAREAKKKEAEILDKVSQAQIQELSDFENREKERQKVLDDSMSKLTALKEEIGNTKIIAHEPSFTQLLGVIIGGIGAGLTGGPNQGLLALNRMIDRDLEVQKENLANKKSTADMQNNFYALVRQKFADERQADNVARLMKMEQFQTMLSQAATEFRGTTAELEAQKTQGALEAEMGKVLMDYELRAQELAGKTAGKGATVYSLGDDVSDLIMNVVPEKLRKTALDEKYAVETYIHDIGMLNDLFEQAKQINAIESFIPGTEAKAKREAIKNGMSQWFANQFVRGVASDQDLARIEKTIADVVSLPGQIEAKRKILLGFVTPPKAPLLRTFKNTSPTLSSTFKMLDGPEKGAPEKRPL